LAPPGKPIAVAWPDAIRLGDGLVGGGRLAWPDGVDGTELPPWLVFGAMIRMVSMTGGRTDWQQLATPLEDEGFGDIDPDRLIESFARHFMRAIDLWREAGFASIANEYASRLECQDGAHQAINNSGDLLIRRSGKAVEFRPLWPELAAPSWLDPDSGAPRR
jgi:biotin/lipoate A/B protein ligase family protein